MRLSTRSTYGMRALVELALSGSRSPISANIIAKRQALSVAYLEQLLHKLKKRGLVSSVRGPKGGYVLAKEPNHITMAEVVYVLDGMNGKSSAKEHANGNSRKATKRIGRRSGGLDNRDLQRYAARIARVVWQCVHERLVQSLDSVTLQDLCDELKSDVVGPLDHRYVFHI